MTTHNSHGGNQMKRLTLAAAAALMFLTGCSSEASSDADKGGEEESAATQFRDSAADADGDLSESEVSEVVFLATMREGTDQYASVPDDTLLGLGRQVCDSYEAGLTFGQIAGLGIKAGFDPMETGYMIGAAATSFCPEYAPEANGNWAK